MCIFLDCLRGPHYKRRMRQLSFELEQNSVALRRLEESRELEMLSQLESKLVRRYECKICMDAFIECVFLPCGHTLACRRCATKCFRCPVCKIEVDTVTGIHVM